MVQVSWNTKTLNSGNRVVRHKVQPGSNVYRIMPPFGDVEVHNGCPFKKWSVAWLVDPQSGRRRPFASPIMDREECPIHEYSRALQEVIKSKEYELKESGLSSQEVREKLKPLNEISWNIKLVHTYAYNTCNKDGEVGVLEVKSTAHKGIKKMLQQYITDYGQDPLSLNSDTAEDSGVWLNIKREGEGKDTEYSVDFSKTKKKVEGEIVYVLDRSPLPENVVSQYSSSLGYDLHTLYYKKSYDELRKILLFNLSLVAEEVPDAVLPGYEEALELSDQPVKESHKAKPKMEEKPPKVAKKKIEINLGDDEDDEDEPPFKPNVKQTNKSKPSSDEDDILAFADDLLE